ncbi:MAG TPA: serine hydrolase [Candidatus Acidoferrales bacterium]|nr:serine hydrolase [Candidatus Acidoferrales bacterium]
MDRRLLVIGVLVCALAGGEIASAQTQAPPDARAAELRAKLGRELNQVAAQFDGVMAIALKDLETNDTIAINADMLMPQASSIKTAVLVELLRQAQAGKLKLEERVEIRKSQFAGGSGVLQDFGDGTSAVSLRDLAALMIVVSDNTATNILIERVGQMQVNTAMQSLGFERTRLMRKMIQPEEERRGVENVSTAREMAGLYEQLYRGKLLDAQHTALAIELLKNEKYEPTPMGRGLPAGVALASKPGSLGGVRCESGIVLLGGHPYVLSVMTTYAADDAAAERAIADVSRRVYAYEERLAHSNAHGVRIP